MENEEKKVKKVRYEDLETYTKLCIQAFETIMKRELSLKKAEEEHGKWLAFIPDKDMNGYFQITEKIRGEYEAKIQTIDDKIHELNVRRGMMKR